MSGNFPKSIKQLCKNLHGSICALCDIYIELGEVAHIISNRGKEKGPRFFTEYPTLTYRNLIDVKNSIYLCRNCHINIDDNKQSGKYSPEYLINARKIHIEKMRILELSKDDHKIEIDKEKNQKWSQLNQPPRHPPPRRSFAPGTAVAEHGLPSHRTPRSAAGGPGAGALDPTAGPLRRKGGRRSASSRALPEAEKPPPCGTPPISQAGMPCCTSPIRTNWPPSPASISTGSRPPANGSTWSPTDGCCARS